MKKLYFLNEEEKERILNLHKEATKNEYLINEVGYGGGNWLDVNYKSQTLTLNNYLEMENKQGGDELKLNKGVVFTVKDTNTLIAKDTPFQIVGDFTGSVSENGKGDVEYYCKSKEFKIIGRDLVYFGEDFQSDVQKAFDDLCGEASSSTPSETTSGTTSGTTDTAEMEKWKNFPCVPKHAKAKQEKLSDSSFTYSIDGSYYYSNGRKQLTDGTMVNYTCNDPEFKTTRSDSTVKQLTTPSDAELDAVLGKL